MSLRFIEIDIRTTSIKDISNKTMNNYSVLITYNDDLLIWSPKDTLFNTKKAEKETYVNLVKALNNKYGGGYSLSAFGLLRFSMIAPTYFNLYIGDTQIGNIEYEDENLMKVIDVDYKVKFNQLNTIKHFL